MVHFYPGLRSLLLGKGIKMVPNPCCPTARTIGYILPKQWPDYYRKWVESMTNAFSAHRSPGIVVDLQSQQKFYEKWDVEHAQFLGVSLETYNTEIRPLLSRRDDLRRQYRRYAYRHSPCLRRLREGIAFREQQIRKITGKQAIDSPSQIKHRKFLDDNLGERALLSPEGYKRLKALRMEKRRLKELRIGTKEIEKEIEQLQNDYPSEYYKNLKGDQWLAHWRYEIRRAKTNLRQAKTKTTIKKHNDTIKQMEDKIEEYNRKTNKSTGIIPVHGPKPFDPKIHGVVSNNNHKQDFNVEPTCWDNDEPTCWEFTCLNCAGLASQCRCIDKWSC